VNTGLVYGRSVSRARVGAGWGDATVSTIARYLAVAMSSGCALAAPQTVALWLFDEPADVAPGATLKDAASGAYPFTLGSSARLVPGKSGRALKLFAPGSREKPPQPHFATRLAAGVNPTGTPLNLGAQDWTIECWLWLAARADTEAVICEIGAGGAAETELVTRFAVLPSENGFVLTGIGHRAGPSVPLKRIEYSNPEGPPGGVAYVETVTLPLTAPVPREQWFHVALVHRENGALRLYVGGLLAAIGTAEVEALPPHIRGYIYLGCDGRSDRVLNGAIDELRISAAAIYLADFTPSDSFSHAAQPQAGANQGDLPPR
jgi:hypothetical protein